MIVLRRVGVEEGRVRRDPEALLLQELDRLDRLVEHALLGHRLVVPLAQAVDVDGEREVGRRLEVELVPALADEFGVRAQVDVLLALDELVDHDVDLRVHQRLTAGDRHHRRAALLDRGDGPLDRHALAQQVVRLLDLAAAVALEVAREQRLELDDQRELLPAGAASALNRYQPMRAPWRIGMAISRATPLGRVNLMSSWVTTRSATSTGPSARSVPMTSSTRCGGADAPGGDADGARVGRATRAGCSAASSTR